MHKLNEKVDAIELKIRQLIHKVEQLERENELLSKDNDRLKKELNQYIDKIEGLIKAGEEQSLKSDLNKVVFKQRINQLAEEVDACIELLNS
jgi:predicted RNase H-like nuclease (RuvC/YqgF family)